MVIYVHVESRALDKIRLIGPPYAFYCWVGVCDFEPSIWGLAGFCDRVRMPVERDLAAVCQACGILVVFEYDIKRRKAEAHESAPKYRESYYQGTPSSRQGTRVSDSVRMLFLPKVFQEARECYPF